RECGGLGLAKIYCGGEPSAPRAGSGKHDCDRSGLTVVHRDLSIGLAGPRQTGGCFLCRILSPRVEGRAPTGANFVGQCPRRGSMVVCQPRFYKASILVVEAMRTRLSARLISGAHVCTQYPCAPLLGYGRLVA